MKKQIMLYALCVFYAPRGVLNAYAHHRRMHGNIYIHYQWFVSTASRITHYVSSMTLTWNPGLINHQKVNTPVTLRYRRRNVIQKKVITKIYLKAVLAIL